MIFALLAECPVLVVDDGTHKIAAIGDLFQLPAVDAVQHYSTTEAEALVARACNPDRNAWRERKRVLGESVRSNLVV